MRPKSMYLAAFVVFGAGSTLAGSAPTTDPPHTATAAAASGSEAMRAYVDPTTGELLPQPPAGMLRPIAPPPAMIPDDSKLEFIEAPDGTRGVFFHGQRQATVTATIGADGSVTTRCVESTAEQPASVPSTGDGSHD